MIKTRCYLRLKLKEPVVRDALLKIGELSQSFSVLSMLYNQESMSYMLRQVTAEVINQFESCTIGTSVTRDINVLRMPPGVKTMTILSQRCITSKDKLEEKMLKRHHKNRFCLNYFAKCCNRSN